MSFPSLHSMRGVVDLFIRTSQGTLKVAEQDPTVSEPKEDKSTVNKKTDTSYSNATGLVNEAGVSYEGVVSRVMGDLLQSAIDLPDDPEKSGFWVDKEVMSLFGVLPNRMFKYMSKALTRELSARLNDVFGVFEYKLTRGSGRADKDDEEDRKVIASFEDADMHSGDVYVRFASILSEETGKKVTPQQVKEDFKVDKKSKQFYDENDLKTNSQISGQKAMDALVDMLTHYRTNPSLFTDKLVEKKHGNLAVTWIRPPKGKTQSAVEQTSEQGRRAMDPAVASLMFDAMENKQPVRWKYVKPEVAPGSEGSSVINLTFALPAIGDQQYTTLIPEDVGLALHDARDGEDFTLHVLNYDPSKGFKVYFKDLRENIVRNKKKSMRSTGVTAQQLSKALESMTHDYVKSMLSSEKQENVSAMAEKLLGKVMVDGKDISVDQGLEELIDFHEQRKTQKDPRGVQKKDKKEEDVSDVWQQFKSEKTQQAELRRKQEEELGPEIAGVQHSKVDMRNRTADKIADKIGRHLSLKAPFTSDARTWTYGTALRSKAALKWLVGLAVDEALKPTKEGAVHWKSLVTGMLTSDDLADAMTTETLFGKGIYEDVLPALKVALVAKDPGASPEQKKEMYEAYRKGSLEVTPEDRRAISKDFVTKGKASVREMVDALNAEIAKAFVDLYRSGDQDASNIVEVSKAHLPARMTKGEKEEWGVDPKKPKVTTSFKTRMDEAKDKLQKAREQDSETARALEQLLLSGDYARAKKTLAAAKVGEEALAELAELSKNVPAEEGTTEHEQQLTAIENISDAYEKALNKASDEKMKDVFKSVVTKEKTEKQVEKQASLFSMAVKIAMSKVA